MNTARFMIVWGIIIIGSLLNALITYTDPYIQAITSKEIDETYKMYLDARSKIFSKLNGSVSSIDPFNDILVDFAEMVDSFIQTGDGKLMASIAKTSLSFFVIPEARVSLKPEEGESHAQFTERVQNTVDQIIQERRVDLKTVFDSVHITENSYLAILYHQYMITLANEENNALLGKTLIDPREHCDALMNGPLFQENAVLIQPPVPIKEIWNSENIVRCREDGVAGIRRYFFWCHLSELARTNEKLGIRFTKEEQEEAFANEDQYLFHEYALSKYPFLSGILDSLNKFND